MNPYVDTTVAPPAGPAARLRHAIAQLLGAVDYGPDTTLVELGVDSLALLRILAIAADDPDREIDPADLHQIQTVRDLDELLTAWAPTGLAG